MANALELIDKSKQIKDEVSRIVSDIKKGILQGSIKNKTEAFLKLQDEVDLFIKRLTGPLMNTKPLGPFPISSDINDMIEKTQYDLEYLLSENSINNEILSGAFNKMELERSMLLNMNRLIEKSVEDLNISIDEMFGSTIYEVFTETFINMDNTDELVNTITPAFIDVSLGALTLSRNNLRNYNSGFKIKLGDRCNGFPGDTHQAYTSGGNIVYSGELEPHLNLEALLDEDRETWFEFEGVKVDQNDFVKTGGFGFEYEEGISWIIKDDTLVLEIVLTSDIQRAMNWVSIIPFVPTERSYVPAQITSLIVSDSRGTLQELCNEPIPFKSEVIKMFNNQYVNEIRITIEQENPYYTPIAHRYYTEMGINHNYLEPVSSEEERIDGPTPSVRALGIRYEPSIGTIKQPEMQDGYTPPDSSSLFYSEEGSLEILNGERYQIGIRGIETAAIQFTNQSQYISTPFVFENPVDRLILTAEEYIPEGFGEGEWIRYYISVDNCITWIEVNSNQEYGILTPVESLRVMILLSRPTEIEGGQYKTPIVYKYKLRGRKSS